MRAAPEENAVEYKGKSNHRLVLDNEVEKFEWKSKHTPSGERQLWEEEQVQKFGDDRPKLTIGEGTYSAFTKSAVLDVVSYDLDGTGLALIVRVKCASEDMAYPHDLVRVSLELRTTAGKARSVHTIAVLTPTEEESCVVVQIHYTLGQLAKVLGITLPQLPPKEQADFIRKDFPEIGVKAEWLVGKYGRNDIIHYSGGVDAKANSGRIRLRPATAEDLAATEQVRNSQWNLSELAAPGRPVYDMHSDILQRDGQLATSLEAESEYLCDRGIHAQVTTRMRALLQELTRWPSLGIVAMTDEGAKEYTDHYFDLPKSGYPLLTRGVVLRRRTVVGDPTGTYLFAVKGRTKLFTAGPIRLTAQANLTGANAGTSQWQTWLRALLTDTGVDNVISRVLRDALGGQAALLAQEDVAEVLVLRSNRIKYRMTLENSTRIEFSADRTTIVGRDSEPALYSFELGLDHPGLFITPVAAFGSAQPSQTTTVVTEHSMITRPYHIPADLDGLELATKPDHAQFIKLRDLLLTTVFGLDAANLEAGGTKAQTIARRLKIIT